MEHALLSPHDVTLRSGIPYHLIRHLVKGRQHHDANLTNRYGSDNDLDEINTMEKNLGPLKPEQVDARVIADFCCIWRYDYPMRIREICSIVGGRSHTALRLHYQICPERRKEFIDYASALQGWMRDRAPDDPSYYADADSSTVEKVYRLLGEKDPLKALLAERTYLGLSMRALNCSFWGDITQGNDVSLAPFTAQDLQEGWPERMSRLENSIRQEMGHAAGNFLCDVGGASEPACHFKFIRRVDILVSSIGVLSWRGNLPPKNGAIKGRRQMTQLYMQILENYWNGAQHCLDDQGRTIKEDLFSRLGEATDFKKWLVACLWKNIKNQTQYSAYPMKQWVEFVRIGENYLQSIC